MDGKLLPKFWAATPRRQQLRQLLPDEVRGTEKGGVGAEQARQGLCTAVPRLPLRAPFKQPPAAASCFSPR